MWLCEQAWQGFPYVALKDLQFLSACIKEGCRIHLSIVYQMPRRATSGKTSSGRLCPRPVHDNVHESFGSTRCKSNFGDDADQWKPGRWIYGESNSEEQVSQADGQKSRDGKRPTEKLARLNAKADSTEFGSGSRTCIGCNLFTFEVCELIGQFLASSLHYCCPILNNSVELAMIFFKINTRRRMIERLGHRRISVS